MAWRKTAGAAVLTGIAVTALSGCVGVLVGGAAVGAGTSVLDRRTTGTQADDEVMELRVKTTALSYLKHRNPTADYTPKLSVVSYNRHILLLGQVSTEAERRFAEQVARAEQSVSAVYNYIEVAPKGRTFADIGADIWGTAKVRTTLLGIQGVYPGRVKIVTYDGVTYVMGILTASEQSAVTERVRTTAGVRKVVTLYQTYRPV
ncbi:MAG: BON domain-containing protein [Neisseria sp.]|nr:BON domain-containing protein [Neisseria sp.]